MNGIEKITGRINADVDAELLNIKKASDKKVAEIRAENERLAQEHYWTLVREGVKDTEQRVSRIGRTARLEAKKNVLSMKQHLVSEAFELAKKKIAGMPDEDYINLFAKFAAEASVSGDEQVVLSRDDRSRVGKSLVEAANARLAELGKKSGLSLSDKTAEMSGGLILRQGDIETNCSVDTLLELSRGELAACVAEVLFGA